MAGNMTKVMEQYSFNFINLQCFLSYIFLKINFQIQTSEKKIPDNSEAFGVLTTDTNNHNSCMTKQLNNLKTYFLNWIKAVLNHDYVNL